MWDQKGKINRNNIIIIIIIIIIINIVIVIIIIIILIVIIINLHLYFAQLCTIITIIINLFVININDSTTKLCHYCYCYYQHYYLLSPSFIDYFNWLKSSMNQIYKLAFNCTDNNNNDAIL